MAKIFRNVFWTIPYIQREKFIDEGIEFRRVVSSVDADPGEF